MNSTMSIPRSLTSLVLTLGVLGACGGPSPDGGAPAPAVRRFLSLGTAPPGGAFFVVGGALAEVAAANGPEGWQVTAEATQGSRENIRRLIDGDLDFALSNAAITYFAVRGETSWDRPYDVASVMTLAPNVALFLTPASSGIRTIADLRGKRVVLGPSGAGFEDFVTPILEAHGLGLGDLQALNAPQSSAVDLLTDASADAAFLGGAVPTASIVQAASSMDLYFVPFDPEVRERLIADYPFFHPATIPAGTYRGQDADFVGLDVGSMHLIAAASADEETVYQFTRTIYENRRQVVERHAAGRAIQPQVVVRRTGTPFHPGAVRYYREIGIWPEDAGTEGSAGDAAAGQPAAGEPEAGEG
jgi:TRAP transporter TAXI family solute receptor